MTQPTNTAAWEADPYWKEVVQVITGGKKLRSDAYLQTLSAGDLDQLRLCLLLPLSLEQQQVRAPKWTGGPRDGEAPSIKLLSELGQAVRQTEMIQSLERQKMINAAARSRGLQLGLDGSLVDTVLTALTEEALKRHAAGLADKFLPAAGKYLLKREDQLMEREKFAESRKTSIERALEEFSQFLKGQPALLAEFEQFRVKVISQVS